MTGRLTLAAVAAALVVVTLAYHPSGAAVTARDVWKNVIQNCANNDVVDIDHVLYTGPTNTLGLGTIWRPVDGGYRPVRDFATVADETLRRKVVHIDTASDCAADATKSKKFSASLVFQALLAPLGVNLSADLSR